MEHISYKKQTEIVNFQGREIPLENLTPILSPEQEAAKRRELEQQLGERGRRMDRLAASLVEQGVEALAAVPSPSTLPAGTLAELVEPALTLREEGCKALEKAIGETVARREKLDLPGARALAGRFQKRGELERQKKALDAAAGEFKEKADLIRAIEAAVRVKLREDHWKGTKAGIQEHRREEQTLSAAWKAGQDRLEALGKQLDQRPRWQEEQRQLEDQARRLEEVLALSAQLEERKKAVGELEKVFSPEERMEAIYYRLLLGEGPVKAEDLAEGLGVSTPTVMRDIREMGQWMEDKQLTVASKKGEGYRLAGREQQLRSCLVQALAEGLGSRRALTRYSLTSRAVERLPWKGQSVAALAARYLSRVDMDALSHLLDNARETLYHTKPEND